jgi:hypothetical protein
MDDEVVFPELARLKTGLWLWDECADQDEVVTEWLCVFVDTVGAVCVCAVDALVDPVITAPNPAPDATDEVWVWLCPAFDVSEYVWPVKVIAPSDAVAEWVCE